MQDAYFSRTTQQVLEHHIHHLGAGNLEEVLLDYAPDAKLINMGGLVQGLKELRAFFQNSIETALPPDTKQTILAKHVAGELAYIVWEADSRFYNVPFGTDTFVIRDGKIVLQTFAGVMNPKAQLEQMERRPL